MNNNTGGSFRVKRNPFTQVSNSALRDNNLSLKAKGLYSLIQSYITMPNFTLYKGYLMSMCKEKEKAFDSAWKELKTSGYLKQYRIPKGKNDSFVYEYELLDVADLTTPALVNLNKHGEKATNSNENTDTESENSHTPHLGPCAKSTLCQKHPVPSGGGISNTDSKDTDSKKDLQNNTHETSVKTSQSVSYPHTLETTDLTTDLSDSTTQQDSPETKKEHSSIPTHHSGKNESPLIDTEINLTQYTTIDEWKAIVQTNINYNAFIQERNPYIKLIDTIVNNIVGILNETNDFIVLNKKENKRIRAEFAKEICLALEHHHITYVLEKFKNVNDPITHKGNYLKAIILSSFTEEEAYYQNEFRQGNL